MTAPFTISEYGTATKGVIFIFGGWRTSKAMYLLGIREFNKLGWRCVLFLPHPKLIAVNSPYQDIVDAGEIANQYVAHYIAESPQDTVFMAMGISFGTLFAADVTKRHQRITKMVLSAPFGDFSKHVGLWNDHWYFGRVLRSQPTDMQASAAVLNRLAIANNIERLAEKQILVLYGNRDKITHTTAVHSIITDLKAANADTIVHASPGGHFRAIFGNSRWIRKNHREFFVL